jgi:hypothetical protein
LKKRAEQVLPGSKGVEVEGEGGEVSGGQGGKMAQAHMNVPAHMNKFLKNVKFGV